MLYPVHRNEPLYHFRNGHCRFLRSRHRYVLPLLAYLAGNGKETKGLAQSAGGKEGQQQKKQFQVWTNLVCYLTTGTFRELTPTKLILSEPHSGICTNKKSVDAECTIRFQRYCKNFTVKYALDLISTNISIFNTDVVYVCYLQATLEHALARRLRHSCKPGS